MSASTMPVTGSCLCGKVQYTINLPSFSQEHVVSHICTCTMCRKNTGALLVPLIAVQPQYVQWNDPAITQLVTNKAKPGDVQPASYRDYESSPGIYRGFCSYCGSTLLWRSNGAEHEDIEIYAGTIDEEVLLGKITSSPNDPIPKRSGGLGKELAVPDFLCHWQNCIPEHAGLFDKTRKYAMSRSSGPELSYEEIQELRNRAGAQL